MNVKIAKWFYLPVMVSCLLAGCEKQEVILHASDALSEYALSEYSEQAKREMNRQQIVEESDAASSAEREETGKDTISETDISKEVIGKIEVIGKKEVIGKIENSEEIHEEEIDKEEIREERKGEDISGDAVLEDGEGQKTVSEEASAADMTISGEVPSAESAWIAGETPKSENIEAETIDKSTTEEGKNIVSEHVHDMVTQWYGAPPDCMHSGYKMVLCSTCGWVDKEACGEVSALEHTPVAEKLQQGNCREDTIIVYTCTACGEEVSYERHTEPDEHLWVMKETLIWDETVFDFVTIAVECCERCNVIKQEVE